MSDTPRDMVLVVWADAHAEDTSGWAFLGDIPDRGEYVVESVGWLLPVGHGGQTGHISVAQSLTQRDDAVDHIVHIPTGMVRGLFLLSKASENVAGATRGKKRTRPD
jgi:hypothetical protein